jgi:hypothetical protein
MCYRFPQVSDASLVSSSLYIILRISAMHEQGRNTVRWYDVPVRAEFLNAILLPKRRHSNTYIGGIFFVHGEWRMVHDLL